jgi:hypothetical protein
MTDDERLLADLATKVRKLTDQVAFRDMLLTQIKSDLKEERASIVAFLQAQSNQWDKDAAGYAALNHASAMIERGLHRTEDYPLGFNVWEKEK